MSEKEKVVCGDCKGVMWVGGVGYRCATKNIDLDPKVVEERIPIECDEFDVAPRSIRPRMRDYREVGITRVFGGGSVQLPKDIRDDFEIKDGDKILWIKKDRREYTFRKVGYRPEFKPHYT